MKGRLRFLKHDLSALKRPLGIPIFKPFPQSLPPLFKVIECVEPPLIISVGDVVSENLSAHGVRLNVAIIDSRSLRRKRQTRVRGKIRYKVVNEASTISSDAWRAVSEAIRVKEEGTSIILVEGEEDLLAIPAIVLAPLRSLVVYGQPHEALVVVIVSKYLKRSLLNFLKKGLIEQGA